MDLSICFKLNVAHCFPQYSAFSCR